jgi:hypothetical protein
MSALDLSTLLQVSAPEALSPADPPATPAIDTSTASTSDSTSSGSFGSSSDSGSNPGSSSSTPGSSSDAFSIDLSVSSQDRADAALVGANLTTTVNSYESAAEEAGAALVDLGGASGITVDEFEESVPPNLAAASALLSELTANSSDNIGMLSAAYAALSSDATLSLTAS